MDSLAETARRPDLTQLEHDKSLVNEDTNPLVKNLRMWRHKAGAHRDAKTLLKDVSLSDEYPLSFTDIQTLLDDGVRIVNHYSYLFIAGVHADRILGHDDYLNVLRAVQAQLDAHDARRQEEGPRQFGVTRGRSSARPIPMVQPATSASSRTVLVNLPRCA